MYFFCSFSWKNWETWHTWMMLHWWTTTGFLCHSTTGSSREFSTKWKQRKTKMAKWQNVKTYFVSVYFWYVGNKCTSKPRFRASSLRLRPLAFGTFWQLLVKKMWPWTLPGQMWKVLTVAFFDWSSGLGGDSVTHRQTDPVTEIPGANISLDVHVKKQL